MDNYQILNIREILGLKKGVAYRGEIAVFVSGAPEDFQLSVDGDRPVYVNAFSYALVTGGSAMVSIDERLFSVSANTVCVLSPLHLTHFHDLSPDFRCMFLCLHKDFIDRTGIFDIRRRIVTGMAVHRNPVIRICAQEGELLEECISDVARQIARNGHRYHAEVIRNSLVRFYLELDNILGGYNGPSGGDCAVIPRERLKLQEFMTLLLDNFRTEHNVAFYAERMNMTPQYLTRIIKGQTGKSVNAFVFEMLYSEARNMLSSTELSIQQISGWLNFADQASFSKFFKRHSGVSPQDFRRSAPVP